jgi:hypothetical protein
VTRKNAAKVAARDRQTKLGGTYRSHLRHVQAQQEDMEARQTTLCASCAPMYGYESVLQGAGISMGGQCFGCGAHHEVLGMFTVPNPAGGFPAKPLTKIELTRRRIVSEEDSFGAFDEAFGDE